VPRDGGVMQVTHHWRDCRTCVSYPRAHFSEGNQGLSNSGKPFSSRAIRKSTKVKEGAALARRGVAPPAVKFKCATIFVTFSWIPSTSRATSAKLIAGEVS